MTVAGREIDCATADVSGACTMFARPERLGLTDGDAGDLVGTVTDVVFVGSTTHVRLDVDGHELQVVLSNDGAGRVPVPGTSVGVRVPPNAVRILNR